MIPRLGHHPAAADLLLLGLLGLLILGTGLGLRHPWPADEPRFVLIARDMVASGDWFFPRVGTELYPDKPPLFFWCLAALFWLTGSVRLTLLLPSLLAGLGVLALVYDLGRRWWDRRSGLAAALLLLLTVQFTLQAHRAQIDMFLTFWTTLGMYGLARHLLDGPSWGWYATAFVSMGLGVISKGVGFLPLFALLPWTWAAARRWPDATRAADWRWAVGPVLLLATVALWLVPMLLLAPASGSAEHAAYRDEILLTQTAERYVNAWHHLKPVWYYLVEVIPLLWLPLSLLLPWLAPAWWRAILDRDLRVWLALGWALAVLIFFSASPGKRGVYLLPALPAVALAAAPYLPTLWERRGPNRAAALLTALLGAASAAAFVYLRWFEPLRAAELAADYGIELWPPLFAVMAMILCGLVACRIRRGLRGLAGLLAGLWLLYGWWIAPALDPVRSGRELIARLEQRRPPGAELGVVAWKEQFLLYLNRPVTLFGYLRRDREQELRDAAAWLVASPGRRLMVNEWARDRCFEARGGLLDFASRTRWYLVEAGDLTRRCTENGDPSVARVYRPPDSPGR